jgi:hypothetical protein
MFKVPCIHWPRFTIRNDGLKTGTNGKLLFASNVKEHLAYAPALAETIGIMENLHLFYNFVNYTQTVTCILSTLALKFASHVSPIMTQSTLKVGAITLGCPKNTAEPMQKLPAHAK